MGRALRRACADRPEDEWPTSRLLGGVWTIFPHVSIAPFDAGGRIYLVSRLFPGATPGTSVTVQTHLAVGPAVVDSLASL